MSVSCGDKDHANGDGPSGTRCRDQANSALFARACIAKYGPRVADWPTDIQVALRVKWAFGLGNGYDATARKISPQLRHAVLDRDNYRCVRCGSPENLVFDHIDGPDSAPDNLQTWCSSCHDARTTEFITPIPDGTKRAAEADWLHRRVMSPTPLRACDTHGWDYAAWKRDHSRTITRRWPSAHDGGAQRREHGSLPVWTRGQLTGVSESVARQQTVNLVRNGRGCRLSLFTRRPRCGRSARGCTPC